MWFHVDVLPKSRKWIYGVVTLSREDALREADGWKARGLRARLRPTPRFHPGTAVWRPFAKGRTEYGTVVHSVWEPKRETYDVWVAFHGMGPLATGQPGKPYLLKCAESLLSSESNQVDTLR